MTCTDFPHPAPTTARPDDSILFAALELSRKSWLVATSAPGEEKVSKRTVSAGDGRALLDLLAGLREKAERRIGKPVKVVVIQEAGLDGFWLHRLLEANGIESHVVDPASIAVDRRKRRRKTNSIDVDALLRTLMAWARGERRVCSMVRPPSPEDEDRRRLSREREALVKERIQHSNRIKGLLAAQGIADFEPLRPDHRARLDRLTTGDGRALPPRLTAEIRRQLARLEAVVTDLKAVEAERDALLAGDKPATPATPAEAVEMAPPEAAVLLRLKGIGPEFASVLCLELLFRSFSNRREVACLWRAHAEPVQKRRHRPGAGHLQVRQPAPAQNDDPTGVDVDPLPAGISDQPLVCRVRWDPARPHPADSDRCCRAKASDRAVAVCHAGHCPGGSRLEELNLNR